MKYLPDKRKVIKSLQHNFLDVIYDTKNLKILFQGLGRFSDKEVTKFGGGGFQRPLYASPHFTMSRVS